MTTSNTIVTVENVGLMDSMVNFLSRLIEWTAYFGSTLFY